MGYGHSSAFSNPLFLALLRNMGYYDLTTRRRASLSTLPPPPLFPSLFLLFSFIFNSLGCAHSTNFKMSSWGFHLLPLGNPRLPLPQSSLEASKAAPTLAGDSRALLAVLWVCGRSSPLAVGVRVWAFICLVSQYWEPWLTFSAAV